MPCHQVPYKYTNWVYLLLNTRGERAQSIQHV
jgi:hypothetical protein